MVLLGVKASSLFHTSLLKFLGKVVDRVGLIWIEMD